MNKLFLIAFVLFSTVNICTGQTANQSNEKEIQKIIASLTLKEKAQLLIGTFGNPKDTAYALMVDKVKKLVPGAAGFTAQFENKGISTQVLADGPAGLRIQPTRKGTEDTYYCTAFPIATLLASTWDTELVGNVGKSMGNEVLEYGVDVILGPGMNLQRNPLCGRNFEYYSEDPLITGKMAASMVNGIQSNGVGTSIKHFAANNQELNRMSVDAIISQRALRELYLRGFEIAVKESQPWTVMSSYNKINGTYTSESNVLLTKILRDDWGFKGYVMTDWGGGSNPVAQMLAGNDVLMPGQFKQVDTLVKAVKAGILSESVLDKNLARVLNVMLKTPKYRKYAYSSKPNLKANAEVTRKAASEGMVLLENKNNALPFDRNIKKVAAFGNTSYEFISGGTGSGDVNEAYTISLIQGLENGGYLADTGLILSYSAYIKDARAKQPKPRGWWDTGKRIAEMTITNEMASKLAQQNDLALITIGRNSGEGSDREAKEGDFYLTPAEKELISIVSESFKKVGKKAVVVLNIGGVIETSSWKNIPDAVLLAWQPGQEGGNSVVDVLSGKINPSGKLAVTFPVSYDDVPSAKSFPGYAIKGENDKAPDQSGFSFNRRVPWEAVYDEDVYVGYRYYNNVSSMKLFR